MATKTRVETYVARKRMQVGDRIVNPGDPVPEAESWRRPQSWVNSGHLAVAFRDSDDVPTPIEEDTADGLESLSVPDLRALAKDRGLRGYSKLAKADLIERLE